jgi:hypothetical protein
VKSLVMGVAITELVDACLKVCCCFMIMGAEVEVRDSRVLAPTLDSNLNLNLNLNLRSGVSWT